MFLTGRGKMRDLPDHPRENIMSVAKKSILTACAAAALSAALCTSAFARDVLRVGTEPTFAPFEFLNTTTKTYEGFDMDLIRAVADKAGYDVEIVNMGFDALIPALSTGNIDVIAAGVSVTDERSKRVDFTTPYYKTGLSLLVSKQNADKYKVFDDLKGKAVAVQIGTTGAEAAKGIEGAKVKNFNTTSEAFMDVAMGGSDAVILDRPVIAYYLKTKPAASKAVQLQPSIADAADFAFAVKKGNKALLDKLNAALDELKKSGEFDKISGKYFAEQ